MKNTNDNLYMDAVLRNFGVEVRNEDRSYKPFGDVVQEIRKIWGDLSEIQRGILVKVLFWG